MISKAEVLEMVKQRGVADALDLKSRAPSMDQTAIIDEEDKIPEFQEKDYSSWAAGSPVKSNGQVWLLLTPYDATVYTGLPQDLRTLWGLAHTKNPLKAKAWVDALGTSGMYYKDECYKDENGVVHRLLVDSTVYTAEQVPNQWETVVFESEDQTEETDPEVAE